MSLRAIMLGTLVVPAFASVALIGAIRSDARRT